ncbi:D-alanyl-D-alanine carboxypeptidase-like protein [Mucilaginibacter oryzae]|uniref:D-alanyl-D-alanine carboxypeptidase-like protein n=1 Tax=Mucilaginibacter oryzae TaxID=468058 RepID=A0A316HVJ6_9SPHI|nr:M15 family metallopeptidase [Mucilaginibacter oryzae]PWK78972.1 D-alanyl-D-alanine carboxypeptidase-like protein [Mucilaginibacter oryzae]
MSLLDSLLPAFKDKVVQLLANCAALGYEMRPNEGLRSPVKQGLYWRQSRTKAQIDEKIEYLQAHGAPFLADCIIKAGPHDGPEITKSIPGMSWHQWGEAIDCVWIVNGHEEWSTSKVVNGHNGYVVYANEAKKLGLTAGGLWTSFKDWPHVQFHSAPSPAGNYSLQQINDIMKQRFSLT